MIIAASICDGWFNDHWFPSYEETYGSLQQYCTAAEFLLSEEALRITQKYEYLFQYSNNYTYHPFHAMSMISGGSVPCSGLRRSSWWDPRHRGTRGAWDSSPSTPLRRPWRGPRRSWARTPGSSAPRSASPAACPFTFDSSQRRRNPHG